MANDICMGGDRVDKAFTGSEEIVDVYLGTDLLMTSAYAITFQLNNCSISGTVPRVVRRGAAVAARVQAATGHELPSNITVTGCEYDWDFSTGDLVLHDPYDSVTCSIEGLAVTTQASKRSKRKAVT